jgi:hypothetical protein
MWRHLCLSVGKVQMDHSCVKDKGGRRSGSGTPVIFKFHRKEATVAAVITIARTATKESFSIRSKRITSRWVSTRPTTTATRGNAIVQP